MVLYCCNVFHSTLLLEIQILLLILLHQSDMGNEIITSAFSVDLEKSSAGRNHYCPACEKRDHATWCEDHAMGKARSSTSADAIRDEDEYDGYA